MSKVSLPVNGDKRYGGERSKEGTWGAGEAWVTALSRVVREGLSEKGPLSQALEGKEGESQGQAQGLRGTRSDLQFGCDMEDVLEARRLVKGLMEFRGPTNGSQVMAAWIAGHSNGVGKSGRTEVAEGQGLATQWGGEGELISSLWLLSQALGGW